MAAELSARLSISTGATSMALTELQKWGVVRKSWRPGERRDFYEAETSIWKMVSRVFRERELVHIREAIDAFAAAKRDLAERRKKAGSDERRRLLFIEGRFDNLLTLSRSAEALLGMLLAGEPVDSSPLRDLPPRDRGA